MGEEVMSAGKNKKISARDSVFFALGAAGALFLFVYGVFISRNVLHAFFGVAIFALEAIIFMKERALGKTKITVYETGVEGIFVPEANSFIAVSANFFYEDIKSIGLQENCLVIKTDDGAYRCYCGGNAEKISKTVEQYAENTKE